MYWEMIKRQMPLLSNEEQEKFKASTVTVIGCGGLGGMTIEMLARMGVGNLILVDEDEFDTSNLNRQILSSVDNLGKSKSESAARRVGKINPYVNVVQYNEHVDSSNIDRLLKDSDVVVDALDNILTRIIATRKAREYKIPFVHGAVHGTLGQVTTFLSNTISYEDMFNLPSADMDLSDEVIASVNKMTSGTPPVIGPAPNLVSCLQAMETFKIITGVGKVTVAPKILTFDLLNFTSFSVDEI